MHNHNHQGCSHHIDKKNMAVAFFLNLIFSIIEIVGGIMVGSFAVIADAIHDAGDTATIGIAWALEKKSQNTPDKEYSYGYARYSLLASVITASVLLCSAIFIVISSIPRLFAPVAPDTTGLMALAVLGIAVNGYSFFKMTSSQGHNAKMLRLHLLEDAAGWVVVLLGGIVMHYTGWYILDPLLAILLSIFIGYNVYKNLIDVIKIFLQRMPGDHDRDSFRNAIEKIDGVEDVHDIHAWSLDHKQIVLTCHIVVANNSNTALIKQKVKEKLNTLGNVHSTIEVEYKSEPCAQDCSG